jgi:hypothetical protein
MQLSRCAGRLRLGRVRRVTAQAVRAKGRKVVGVWMSVLS